MVRFIVCGGGGMGAVLLLLLLLLRLVLILLDDEDEDASSTSEEVLGRCDRVDCLRYIGCAAGKGAPKSCGECKTAETSGTVQRQGAASGRRKRTTSGSATATATGRRCAMRRTDRKRESVHNNEGAAKGG